MIAQQDDIFSETVEAVYNFNRDEQTRYICEMLEEGERVMLTYTNEIARLKEKNKQTARTHKKEIAKKDAIIAEKDSALNKMASEIDSLKAQLAALQQSR